jgi:hypothetical protein
MFIVYEHTNSINGKKYVGYTSKTISERLHKHYTNAMGGMDNHFYKAIRKYGLGVFESKIIGEYLTREEAKTNEIRYIEECNSFKEGYNMTKGGDGGWVVPDEKYDSWVQKISETSTMENNSRWSGISDDKILELAREYYLEYGHQMGIKKFMDWGNENHSIPKSFSKNRFGGKTLKESYCEKYNIDPKEIRYVKTKEHKESLSTAGTGKHWYYNDQTKTNKQFLTPPNNEWKLGRITWE